MGKELFAVLFALCVLTSSALQEDRIATLTLSNLAGFEMDDPIQVSFQYTSTSTESESDRSSDYIALFLGQSLLDLAPMHVAGQMTQASGTVTVSAGGKSGKLTAQIIRPPNFQLASIDVTVFPPCQSNCFSRGKCVHGVCVCDVPYAGTHCQMLEPSAGIRVEIAKFQKSYTVAETIHVTVASASGNRLKMNGMDFVGIYRYNLLEATASGSAVEWAVIPNGLGSSLSIQSIQPIN
jgi:hypothetical protein